MRIRSATSAGMPWILRSPPELPAVYSCRVASRKRRSRGVFAVSTCCTRLNGIAETERRLDRMWAFFDGVLAKPGPYLLGEALSAADLLLIMYMRWSRKMPFCCS